jgi:hypothetical protein
VRGGKGNGGFFFVLVSLLSPHVVHHFLGYHIVHCFHACHFLVIVLLIISLVIPINKSCQSPPMNKHFLSHKISLVERCSLRELFGKTCFGAISILKNGVGSGGKNLR